MRQPNVLISVLNWNNAPDTIKCIHSLKKLAYPSFTIVITDNNSIDNSADLIHKEFPELHIIRSKENLGYSGGNKLAWEWGKEKQFELFWIVNNDTEVKSDCLTQFAVAYIQYGNAIYGGISLEPDDKTISFGGGFEFDNDKAIDLKSYNIYSGKKISEYKNKLMFREVGDINGANMIIPTEIIQKYGYIDTRFFLYAEELDYCFKLRQEYGIPSYLVPTAIVVHNASASFKKNNYVKNIGIYYNARNWHFFQLNHISKKKSDLIKSEFSILKLFETYIQSIFFKKKFFLKNENRTRNLAFLHALSGKKEKFFEPNDYL